jgi:hypothetical protein
LAVLAEQIFGGKILKTCACAVSHQIFGGKILKFAHAQSLSHLFFRLAASFFRSASARSSSSADLHQST